MATVKRNLPPPVKLPPPTYTVELSKREFAFLRNLMGDYLYQEWQRDIWTVFDAQMSRLEATLTIEDME